MYDSGKEKQFKEK